MRKLMLSNEKKKTLIHCLCTSIPIICSSTTLQHLCLERVYPSTCSQLVPIFVSSSSKAAYIFSRSESDGEFERTPSLCEATGCCSLGGAMSLSKRYRGGNGSTSRRRMNLLRYHGSFLT